ncbi:MAG: type II toxin-antitoxin system RelE/ParE family toxin [Acidobacteria bacterium]|nr:type II toxin-antitoxin system RelE/ParE family toxin [Acidobacteriota bacterium]
MAAGKRSVRAVPRFLKSKRRASEAVQFEVDAQVMLLIENPLLGEMKSGGLRDVRVVKFKVRTQQYLLAYRFFSRPNVIELLDLGPHENFYRDLQKHIQSA